MMKPDGFVSKEWTGLFGNEEFPTKILWPKKDGNCDIPMIELTPALQELVEAACEWNALLEKADECTGSFELTPEQEDTFLKLDTSAMRLRKAAKAFKDDSK